MQRSLSSCLQGQTGLLGQTGLCEPYHDCEQRLVCSANPCLEGKHISPESCSNGSLAAIMHNLCPAACNGQYHLNSAAPQGQVA